MFLKFTRMDGTPIWINGSYIVTVEPRRMGGSVVVPIGDGLDYDVREEPGTVLAMLGEVPAPTVVPVPSNAALAPMPADMSAEMGRVQNIVELPSDADTSEPSTEHQAPGTAALPLSTQHQAPGTGDEVASEEKPKKKTRTKRKTKADAEAEKVAEESAETAPSAASETETPPAEEAAPPPPPVVFEAEVEVPAKKKRRVKKPPLLLDDEQIERLRKMAPRTVKKLKNTLKAQFATVNDDETIVALEAHGVIALGANEHIVWMA